MRKIYHRTIGQSKLNLLNKYAKGSWVNIESPTEEDIAFLYEKTGLQQEVIDDILDQQEIPKIEQSGENTIVILKVPYADLNSEGLFNFTVIMNREVIISISQHPNNLVKSIIERSLSIYTSQRSKLFFMLLQELANIYQRNIERIRRQIENQKNKLDKVGDPQILKLLSYEEILNKYNNALQPTKYMLNKITKGKLISIFASDEEAVQDMYEDFNQAAEICLLNLKSIVTLRDSYKILIDLNLNRTIKFLTSFTILLTIPTIIASLFGMNVALPLAERADSFQLIILLIVATVAAAIAIFYWKRWL